MCRTFDVLSCHTAVNSHPVPRLLILQGILAEILAPIMGKGLIPADPVTWSTRRRQIAPAFHKAWLNHMIGLFAHCNTPLLASLDKLANSTGKVEMEEKFCSVALDIIGKAVFNYDFGFLPVRKKIVTIVGKPIRIEESVDHPSQELIDEYHQKYVEQLEELYDKYKDKYAPDRIRDLRLVR